MSGKRTFPPDVTIRPFENDQMSKEGDYIFAFMIIVFVFASFIILCVCPLIELFCARKNPLRMMAPNVPPVPNLQAGQVAPLAAAGVATAVAGAAAGAALASHRGQQQQQQYYPNQYYGGQPPPMSYPQNYPPQYPGSQYPGPPQPMQPFNSQYPGSAPVPGYPPPAVQALPQTTTNQRDNFDDEDSFES